MNPLCEPIFFSGKDGYLYSGLLFRAQKNKGTIIHIHGSCGNFLSFTALLDETSHLVESGYNLFSFNLKAHDCITEGNWINGKYEYVGGSITDFNNCIEDIQSAIDFCKGFSDKIILQGHSMGCERVLTYQIESNEYYDTILISPCDAYALQHKYVYPETIEEQIKRLSSEANNRLLLKEYGIDNNGEKYSIPIYLQSFLSILNSNALKLFRVDKPTQFFLPTRCLCFIGTRDRLQTNKAETMFSLISENFKSFSSCAFDTDHEFNNYGKNLGQKIVNWIEDM